MAVSDPVELSIVEAFVDSALAADCTVSVVDGIDGGDMVVTRSRDASVVLAALGSTGSDVLSLRRDGRWIGSLVFVWGNGVDVFADASWPAAVPYEGSWFEAVCVSAERSLALRLASFGDSL